MSGPVDAVATSPAARGSTASAAVDVTPSRAATVGTTTVRRALPQRVRRTVGAWCFADHMGPADVADRDGGIGPHPHIGLQTVTWLVDGELLHRDSLGSEQLIRPGQLNVMTAGQGVAHAEEHTTRTERLHGIQLWVAQPEATRHGPPAFEHHGDLPRLELDNGEATVLVGTVGDTTSAARRDTDHLGAELRLRAGTSTLPLAADHEHALVVLEGAVEIDGTRVAPGHLAHLGTGRDELALTAPSSCRVMLLGGTPFGEAVSMWWNFVGRSHDELTTAGDDWNAGAERFGAVVSRLDRIAAPTPPWSPPAIRP